MKQPPVMLLEDATSRFFAGHVTNFVEEKHFKHRNWIFDIPFQPQTPEHQAKWREEHLSLMQRHRDLISSSSRALTQQQAVAGSVSNRSSKVWPNKGCTKKHWKYDKDG